MINRNNYEEYLLMYIDGELSSVEKKQVEDFLEINPDLKEELQVLQQTILQPESEISFGGKDVLYKKEAGITLTNYQEYFLLYVDGELNGTQKEAVETFVLQHPELQDEFTLLKQTILPQETIVFRNKEILYRKEEKRRPVIISMRWASLAAAIMIGVVAIVWTINNGKTQDGGGQATATTTSGQSSVPSTQGNEINTSQPAKTLPVTVDNNQVAITNQNAGNPSKQNAPSISTPSQQRVLQPEPIAIAPKQQDVVPQPVQVDPITLAANNNANNGISNPVAVNTLNDNGKKETHTGTPDDVAANTNNYVQPAVYTEELNTEENSKDIYVGSIQVNTDKVRGFFRKAGRFLSGKVKNKDGNNDKVQVANIEINKSK